MNPHGYSLSTSPARADIFWLYLLLTWGTPKNSITKLNQNSFQSYFSTSDSIWLAWLNSTKHFLAPTDQSNWKLMCGPAQTLLVVTNVKWTYWWVIIQIVESIRYVKWTLMRTITWTVESLTNVKWPKCEKYPKLLNI